MILSRFISSANVDLFTSKPWTRQVQKRTFIPNLFGKVGILGVPFGKGQGCTGVKEEGLTQAPDIIRSTGFAEDLTFMGVDVCDYGNVSYVPAGPELCYDNMTNLNHVAPCVKEVFSYVRRILSDARICLTIGGDHSLAAGTISGHMSFTGPNDIALVYVDAHADLNTCSTSETGSIHGMPLALLANELTCQWPGRIPGLEWLCPVYVLRCIVWDCTLSVKLIDKPLNSLSVKNFAYVGLRSIDPWESYYITRHNICAFTMEDIQKFGSQIIIRKALEFIDPEHRKSIHLSLDIDSLDYFEAPCTTVPVRGGLTLREALDIVEAIYRTRRLAVVDLVELNPLLGNEYQRQITLDAAKHLILGLFGRSRRGNAF